MRRKLLKIILVTGSILAILLAVIGIAFLIASHLANTTRLPPELLQPSIGLVLAPPEKAHPATPVAALPQDVLEKINTLEDYLRARLARERINPAITLYLEALKHYEGEGIRKKAEDARILYIHDRVNPQQALFFREQAGFFDLMHRLTQAGTVPAPDPAEAQTIYKNTAFFKSGNLFLLNAIRILTNYALWRAEEGDYASCRQGLLDALRLVEQLPGNPGIIGLAIKNGSLMGIQEVVQTCVEKFKFPSAELRELEPALEDAERVLLSPDRPRREMFESCRLERGPVVAAMASGTWRRKEFGWFADEMPQYYWLNFHLWRGRTLRVPHVFAYAKDAVRAIHNRRHAPEALRNYDRFYRLEIESSERFINGQPDTADWSHVENYSSFIFPLDAKSAQDLHEANLSQIAGKYLLASAYMHLCRLGVAWRLDPHKTLARRNEDFRNDPFHPWRDPYNGKTLQMIETTSQTMIYSLGEDRKDQGGSEKSDDVVIHIPH